MNRIYVPCIKCGVETISGVKLCPLCVLTDYSVLNDDTIESETNNYSSDMQEYNATNLPSLEDSHRAGSLHKEVGKHPTTEQTEIIDNDLANELDSLIIAVENELLRLDLEYKAATEKGEHELMHELFPRIEQLMTERKMIDAVIRGDAEIEGLMRNWTLDDLLLFRGTEEVEEVVEEVAEEVVEEVVEKDIISDVDVLDTDSLSSNLDGNYQLITPPGTTEVSNFEQATIYFLRSLNPEQVNMFKKLIGLIDEKGGQKSEDHEASDLAPASTTNGHNYTPKGNIKSPSVSSFTHRSKRNTSGKSSINSRVRTSFSNTFSNITSKNKHIIVTLSVIGIILIVSMGYLLINGADMALSIDDADGDGVPDIEDAFPNQAMYSSDSDGDGLADKYEWNIGTDSTSRDTDRDGLEDGDEVDRGLDPLSSDSDDDGYSDSLDLYPLSDWVALIEFSGTETENNDICDNAGSSQMTWRVSNSVQSESEGTASGYGSASGTHILDLPDDQSEVSVTFTVDGWYTDCYLSNEEQFFYGTFGQYMHTASDPGGDAQSYASFTFLLSPGSNYDGTSIGSRTTDNWRDGGWLSRATISVQS